MGLFSFSGSRSNSQSRGFSESSGESGSAGGSLSGGSAVSGSESAQNIAFEDVFARLFGAAEGAAGGLDASLLTDAANQLFTGGTDFLDSIGGDAGTAFLEDRLEGDALLEEQISLLSEDVGRFFTEQLNPAIESEAVGGGALGGGRQGVAQAGATRAAGDVFARGASQLRTRDLESRDRAAGTLLQGNIAGAQTGLAALPQLLGLAESETLGGLAPLAMLSQILGPQMALTDSTSFSTSEDFARAFSESFGRDRSRSQTSSDSSSRSFGIGF